MVIDKEDPLHKIIINNNEITVAKDEELLGIFLDEELDKDEELLGIFLDSKLNIESHISSLCKKAGHEINSLARINIYLKSDQRNVH